MGALRRARSVAGRGCGTGWPRPPPPSRPCARSRRPATPRARGGSQPPVVCPRARSIPRRREPLPLQVPFSGGHGGPRTPRLPGRSREPGPTRRAEIPGPTTGARRRCHRGKLSVLKASLPLGWMLLHGMSKHRPNVACRVVLALVSIAENCGSRSPTAPPPGRAAAVCVRGGWAVCARRLRPVAPRPLPPRVPPPASRGARGRLRAPIVPDGTAQGERYCNARGEILRPWQDQRQRRRSARVRPSIKNVSVGSEDDQTPS